MKNYCSLPGRMGSMPFHVLLQAALLSSFWKTAKNSGLSCYAEVNGNFAIDFKDTRSKSGPLLANPVFIVLSRY